MYKLSCVGNKTFMEAPYDNDLVTNIFYHNNSIKIIDIDLASGKCNLPSQAITSIFFPAGFDLAYDLDVPCGWWWAGFINV